MAEADKDGRMAQFVSDLLACVAMDMSERFLEAEAGVLALERHCREEWKP